MKTFNYTNAKVVEFSEVISDPNYFVPGGRFQGEILIKVS